MSNFTPWQQTYCLSGRRTLVSLFRQIIEDINKGDVNCDLEVNIADVNAVINCILGGNGYTNAADVNGDGEVNIVDINAVIKIILEGCQE